VAGGDTLGICSGGVVMGRVSVPADVADRVGFLAGRGSDCVTGQTLIIDGGCSLIECRGLVMDMHSETIIVVTLTVYPSPMPSSNVPVFSRPRPNAPPYLTRPNRNTTFPPTGPEIYVSACSIPASSPPSTISVVKFA